ncbi:hypothetical protein [Halostagnicola sp. A56]|uniref:hypothetical protein n=1 Tax=Halostagnicola sp. A56 TaxID=1495067 RepID=UPI000678D465|nr:hypothetical protein [Halostagnicola sp. A56]
MEMEEHLFSAVLAVEPADGAKVGKMEPGQMVVVVEKQMIGQDLTIMGVLAVKNMVMMGLTGAMALTEI